METKKRSSFGVIAVILLVSAFVASCSSNDPAANGAMALKMEAASATGSTINGRLAINGRTMATTTITDFKVSLREVKFEFDKEDARFKTDSSFNEDVKLKGPFVVDILEPNGFVEQLVTTVNLPNAKYEEVEFIFHKSTDAGTMSGKSIYIAGTVNGKPFIFWHDTSESIKIDFENPATDLVINGNAASTVITFNLEKLFSTINGGVNLSLATDGDSDGVIEINPGSTDNDGNKDLADAIKNLLKTTTDLMDDKD